MDSANYYSLSRARRGLAPSSPLGEGAGEASATLPGAFSAQASGSAQDDRPRLPMIAGADLVVTEPLGLQVDVIVVGSFEEILGRFRRGTDHHDTRQADVEVSRDQLVVAIGVDSKAEGDEPAASSHLLDAVLVGSGPVHRDRLPTVVDLNERASSGPRTKNG